MIAEARISELEYVVSQQQVQINGLNDAHNNLYQDCITLHQDFTALREEHQALRECLIDSDLLQRSKIRTQSRICSQLHLIRNVLDNQRVVSALCLFVGDAGACIARLAGASGAFGAIRKALSALCAQGDGKLHDGAREAGDEQADEASNGVPADIPDLDDAAWNEIRDREPSRAVLDKWARSPTVCNVIRNFVVEDVVGGADVMKFRDVHRLLDQMGLSLDRLVNSFPWERTFEGRCTAHVLTTMANRVLRKVGSGEADAREEIKCRDLYRLLEILGFDIDKFAEIFAEDLDAHSNETPCMGSYRVVREIGVGYRGVCCYLAEHVTLKTQVALKWPVDREELTVLTDIAERACTGVPRVVASGKYQCQHYAVMELLGSSLTRVFERLEDQPWDQRLHAICVIGRLVLRRLQSLHQGGYVHCDVSPDNILLGRARGGGEPRSAPYLIDFGLARRYPGGGNLGGDKGSAEWSSIRSADGGERQPEDDIEALGWVLVNGLLGPLPWFTLLNYECGSWSDAEARMEIIRQVQQTKLRFLEAGWEEAGQLMRVPDELAEFILMCRAPKGEDEEEGANYSFFAALLGANEDLTVEEAEQEDLRQFAEDVTPLL